MKKIALAVMVVALTGCASVQYGDKAAEVNLKKFPTVSGKTSVVFHSVWNLIGYWLE